MMLFGVGIELPHLVPVYGLQRGHAGQKRPGDFALGGIRLAAMKISPNIRTALAADDADEPQLNIRQPYFIRPSVRHRGDRMTALVVCAIDQHAG
jgi:hypothetical protein